MLRHDLKWGENQNQLDGLPSLSGNSRIMHSSLSWHRNLKSLWIGSCMSSQENVRCTYRCRHPSRGYFGSLMQTKSSIWMLRLIDYSVKKQTTYPLIKDRCICIYWNETGYAFCLLYKQIFSGNLSFRLQCRLFVWRPNRPLAKWSTDPAKSTICLAFRFISLALIVGSSLN